MTNERIILITGGSRGLGRASALALADAGNDVVITYRSDVAAAADVVGQIEARGRGALALDTTDPGAFAAFQVQLTEALAARWGRSSIDGLVNNAGFAGDTPFGAIEQAQIERLVAVHFTGVILLTQQLAGMIAEGGSVLNVSTGLAHKVLNPAYSVYSAVKSAIETWTLYLAQALAPRGITANVIAPGATATDFAGGNIRDNDRYRQMIVPSVAMGRIGEPDDIGRVVAGLLDPRMAWVTGQRIEASGGQRL